MQGLIFGCGYLGSRVADLWLEAGPRPSVVTRSPERAARLVEQGFAAVRGDVTDASSLASLPSSDITLYAVGFDRNSSSTRREVVVEGLRNTLQALTGKSRRLVFISTSSVYGAADGRPVDEDTMAEPSGESGRLALEAERLVAASPFETIILRLSGLYGPGRLLRRVEQMRQQTPIAGRPDAWMNLIHVDDAARAVTLAADRLLAGGGDPARGSSHETYLVSDDCPLRRRDYYGMLAAAAGAPAPMFDPEAGGSRIAGWGKRCRNDRVKHALGLELRYPRVTERLLRELLMRDSG